MEFGRAVYHVEIATFDKPEFSQPLQELLKISSGKVRFAVPQPSNNRPLFCLRLHRKRPRCRNATDKADKFPSSHGRPLGRNVQDRRNISLKKEGAHVRFGSKADMCSAQRHVRFTPNSDIDCVFRDICFGPKADTATFTLVVSTALWLTHKNPCLPLRPIALSQIQH